MKTNRQSKVVTYGDMIMELTKPGEGMADEPACIMAGVGEIDEGAENYVDGAGICSVSEDRDGSLKIAVGDSGSMTWRKVISAIRRAKGGLLDRAAVVRIGYRGPGGKLVDFDGGEVLKRTVDDCTMLPDDTIWNVSLGPKV